jgi:glycosyltransferase domain-containing protein
MGLADLSKLTIVIPTYLRREYALRQFKYWRNTEVQVVILDGSPTAMEIPSELRSDNIRYVHTGTSFTERLATAGRFVSTKYCAMLSDDEFFAISGLRAAIEQLETDESILGCVGRCLYFFVDQDRFLLKDAYREWMPFSEAAISQSVRLDEDLPPKKTHMAHYAVMRSAAWIQIMEDAYRQPFSSAYTYERLVNLQRSILGRTVILENLLWFRSMENRNISVNVVGGPGFLAWAGDPKYAAEVTQYRSIARALLVKGGVSPEDADQFERRFFEVGVQKTLERKSKFQKRFQDKFRAKLLQWSPKSLRLFVKRNLPARLLSFSGWEGYDMEHICESLISRHTSFDRNEIERVRELALETSRQLANKDSSNDGY